MSPVLNTPPRIVSRQTNRKRILGGNDSVKIAIVQKSHPYLDRDGTLEIACEAILEAGQNGAQLVVFPENWLAGYPYWSPGWNTDGARFRQAYADWHDAAIMAGTEDTERLGAAALKAGVYVAIGCNEMDPRVESDQIYSSVMLFEPSGKHIGTHRKTMPTFQEKMFWGMGDANDLKVFPTDIGNIGILICGEHSMTPLRAALIAQREDFHVSVWHGSFHLNKGPTLVEDDQDQSNFIGVPLSRSHAIESGAFVAMACTYLDPADIPDDQPLTKGDPDFRNFNHSNGGSTVFNPMGMAMTEPLINAPGIIYADCPAWMRKTRAAILDTFGHYARPDLVQVLVRKPGMGGWRIAGPERQQLDTRNLDALHAAAEINDVDPELILAQIELE
ncbi:nitrilase-related carbon-nitrogen hydrolase [Nitratireductor sp.]|uniref:nitrilase-related carbon-nitrogen hydrolase n=1 Tax=Nitratireductor sp. TaxID=1872084 RepID=UPI0025DD68FD|nr:nitrilase-related carbon-nitrogen hydrolase [Nitratireductor sp.]